VEEREREVATREKKMREGGVRARAWGGGRQGAHQGLGRVGPRAGPDRGLGRKLTDRTNL
jgi:hypothetical protein